ncbi:unnamed protein product [Rotaria magnacalcarata]|uniref:ADP ribosyltransferase domain-containing protein n=1 Tax=Rotaria magnacalcarata TaxID=392030 RepID=A0A816YQ71_9BILA|nr:unnamed protein product [Rotaria magnacalcarata]
MAEAVPVNYRAVNDANKQKSMLIWFDPKMASHQDTEKVKEKFILITDNFNFLIDLEKCVDIIQNNCEGKIYFITSGSMASQLVLLSIAFPQIVSIFIFCVKKDQYVHLLDKSKKVIGIFDNLGDLLQSIKLQINLNNKRRRTFSILNETIKLTENLSKGSMEFLSFQLFKQVISSLPKNEQSKQQIVRLSKDYYRGNAKELKLIEEFDQGYAPRDAILWYSKQSFIYKLINQAFRTDNIDLLCKFGFIFNDLSENLKPEHRKFFVSEEKTLTVYRGMRLDRHEFDKLNKNKGKLISTNGYLSTSRQKSKAESFCNKSTRRWDTISVLLEITCDLEQMDKNTVFADISQLSQYPHEQEVLFDVNSCFKINSIEETETYATIKMNVSNEGQKVVKEYLEFTKEETGEDNAKIVFGKLLCSLGEYDKSKKYFELLLNDSNAEDLARIEFNIGRALYLKSELNEARKYYQRAHDHMQQKKQERTIHFAHVLNNIGIISSDQNKFDEALGYYQQALKIKQDFYQGDHVDIARSLTNIGITLGDQGKRDESLGFHQRALKIYEKLLPAGHIDIISSRSIITEILTHHEKYAEQFPRSPSPQRTNHHIPPTEPFDITSSRSSRSGTLEERRKENEPFHFPQRASTSIQRIRSPDRPDLPFSCSHMGETMGHGEQHAESLPRPRSPQRTNHHIPPTEPFDITSSRSSRSDTLEERRKENEPFHFPQRASTSTQTIPSSEQHDVRSGRGPTGEPVRDHEAYEEPILFHHPVSETQHRADPSSHI